MLAVRKLAPAPGISIETVAAPPAPKAGEVAVQVHAAGICGSDVHAYQWSQGYEFMRKHMPVTLGHEFAGTVVEVGPGTSRLTVGDKVAVMPTSSCMQCVSCLSGEMHLCSHRQTLGLTRDGGFCRRLNVPANSCVVLADNTDLTLAALIEPLSVGDNAANVAELQLSDTVLVLGPGTIGQAVIRAARWRGCTTVIAVGMHDSTRLQVASAVGASHIIDLGHHPSLSASLQQITGLTQVDVVIEATGHSASIKDGLSVLRKGGTLVTAGIHKDPVTLDLTAFVRNQHQLRAAHGSRRKSWESIARRIASNPEDVRPMISMELALQEAEQGFQHCVERTASKVILYPI